MALETILSALSRKNLTRPRSIGRGRILLAKTGKSSIIRDLGMSSTIRSSEPFSKTLLKFHGRAYYVILNAEGVIRCHYGEDNRFNPDWALVNSATFFDNGKFASMGTKTQTHQRVLSGSTQSSGSVQAMPISESLRPNLMSNPEWV
ncbi:hypothetical protein F5X98DRAFT_328628 [Xylaria grammica]|nr:hypothetical protein F5X98DRAFT_328628 [Xylaria grammica]